jgi:hypothetical protein
MVMCGSFPVSPESRGDGRESGPLQRFVGGVVLVAILCFFLLLRAWRRA